MKAFRFRLEQALRWRAAQVTLEESRVATAAGRVAALRAEAEALRSDLRNGGRQLSEGATGSALAAWASYAARVRGRMAQLAHQIPEAERTLATAMKSLTEANQKRRLLENLKEAGLAEWSGEFDREMEAFAAEAFLIRLQSGRRTGA